MNYPLLHDRQRELEELHLRSQRGPLRSWRGQAARVPTSASDIRRLQILNLLLPGGVTLDKSLQCGCDHETVYMECLACSKQLVNCYLSFFFCVSSRNIIDLTNVFWGPIKGLSSFQDLGCSKMFKLKMLRAVKHCFSRPKKVCKHSLPC